MQSDDGSGVFWFLLGFAALCAYFAPTTIAQWRRHRSFPAIALANLFFGWTVVGWLVCLIWSVSAVGDYVSMERPKE